MTKSYLTNQRITLRAIEPEDVDQLFLIENDPSLWEVGNNTPPISRHLLWNYANNYDADIFSAKQLRLNVICNETNSIIGAIDIYEFDPRNSRAFIGITILKSQQGKKIGTEALHLVCDYAHSFLNINQLAAVVATDNQPCLAIFQNNKFETSGTLKSWQRSGTTYKDAFILQRVF